jgi:hypothetical protein
MVSTLAQQFSPHWMPSSVTSQAATVGVASEAGAVFSVVSALKAAMLPSVTALMSAIVFIGLQSAPTFACLQEKNLSDIIVDIKGVRKNKIEIYNEKFKKNKKNAFL